MLIIQLHIKFHFHSYITSLSIATTRKVKFRFHTAMLFFHSTEEVTLTKTAHFLKLYLSPYKISGHSVALVLLPSQKVAQLPCWYI